MEKPAAQRLAALDTLRGIAVLLVLARHMRLPRGLSPWLDVPIRTLERGGWIGVDLFFVLSGFLVSGLLFREWSRHGELRAGRFLIRRGFKIYPAFFVMLAVVMIWSACFGRWPGWGPVAAEALFVQNYWAGIFPHTWTLAIEEHFYLALPLVLFALRGEKERPFAAVPALFAGVAVGCLALRVAGAWEQVNATRASLAPTHLRVDSLLFGVFLQWLMHFHGERLGGFVLRWRWWMLASAAALAAPAFVFELVPTWYLFTFGFSALYVAGGLVLLVAIHHPARRGALAWIGFYSYSIYLWHMAVDRIFLPLLLPRDIEPLLWLAAYFLASIAVGVLAAWIVEMPFLRLRDRWFPSGSEAARAERRPPLDVTAPALTTRGHVA
ncbi:MAG: acyltransferase [Chthoniobacteraceae bacterium]